MQGENGGRLVAQEAGHAQARRSASAPVLLCVASSAGGVSILQAFFDRLPRSSHLAVIVLQHVASQRKSWLPEILRLHTSMDVREARDGERITPGVVYLAPTGHHLLVSEDNTLEVRDAAGSSGARPSADLLLESVARHYTGRVLGIVLTGMGQDGSVGIQAVHQRGGVVIVQDPEGAKFRSMPDAAIATGEVDFVLSLEEMSTVVADVLDQEMLDE